MIESSACPFSLNPRKSGWGGAHPRNGQRGVHLSQKKQTTTNKTIKHKDQTKYCSHGDCNGDISKFLSISYRCVENEARHPSRNKIKEEERSDELSGFHQLGINM